MMIVAIIPARGGSKRIPGKNTRPFRGRPIIEYPLEIALNSGLFDRVIVSTDSERIADVARNAGAEVPFSRPKDLATDSATTAEVLLHALSWLQEHGVAAKYVCCIYPTAVFVRNSDLAEGYELLRREEVATVFPVTTFDFCVQRAMRRKDDGRVEMVSPEHELTPSNDLPEYYHDAGQFYWLDASAFIQSRRLYSEKSLSIIMPRHRVVDIDTEEDWLLAEKLYAARMELEE
jgi:pseudaminic acid cytidylyltransferase